MESAPRRVVGEVMVVDVSTPEESSVTYELPVLEELQSVFSTEMAHASYIPFYCLIGKECFILAADLENVLLAFIKSAFWVL